MNVLGPKWDISSTIYSANQTIELTQANLGELSKRLKPGDLESLRAKTAELKIRRSGQSEKLDIQKAHTKNKNEEAKVLRTQIINLRNMVKAVTNDSDKYQAFGIGTDVKVTSVASLRAGANMIINGFNTYTDWAKTEAGLLEEDIEELETMNENLDNADDLQEKAIYSRKINTLDRDTIQREIEDLICKFSALGVMVYSAKNPALAKLFSDLIPSRCTCSEEESDQENVETSENDLTSA